MIQYVSNKGGEPPVDFETAILNGRPSDGGLYVPTELPKISLAQLTAWKDLKYTDLAFEILSLFIDESTIPWKKLRELIELSFSTFYHSEKIPGYSFSSGKNVHIQELFHGPTLSFKDIAMGFIVNLFNFFLERRGEKMSIVVATSGDTGPAAAYACIGKKTLNTWIFYPEGFITEEQERQMTTMNAPNIHVVRFRNCPDGSDDLDDLITDLFANQELKKELRLSSVNSINWGRVMMQTVHYFYGYLQTVGEIGELLNFAVPSGAFGNLCAGSLAREMGLPVGKFILANNQNICLQRIFSRGVYLKEAIVNCAANAIDISIPINFWRYLYFMVNQDSKKIKTWMDQAEETGTVAFDQATFEKYSRGFLTASISNEQTLKTIKNIYASEKYLLDPHGAVAVAAVDVVKGELEEQTKVLCLATAHPAKFPAIIKKSLETNELPIEATHFTIESAKGICQRFYECDFSNMHQFIPKTMKNASKF